MKRAKHVLIVLTVLALCALFGFRRDIGAGVNDRYKEALWERYFGAGQTDGLEVLESSDYCGIEESSGEFIVWVGVVIRSGFSQGELEALLEQRYEGTVDVRCVPYDAAFANSHGFTGIQKETTGLESTKGYYFIGITFEPKTKIDKRNKT